MSRGPSGRIVAELEPDLKHQLYVALSSDRMTFKEWLVGQAERYISEQRQPTLFAAEVQPPTKSRSAEQDNRVNKTRNLYGRKKNSVSAR